MLPLVGQLSVLGSSRGIGAPFDPLSISGLRLWLKADAITGLSDGQALASWTDLSGQNNHATQGTGSRQPLYKTNALNGLPVVRFDGVDDFLGGAGLSTFISASAATILAVFKAIAIDTNLAGAWQNDMLLGETGGYFGLSLRSTPLVYGFNFSSAEQKTQATIAAGTPYVVSLQHAGGLLALALNGGAPSSVASGNTAVISGALRLGGSMAASAYANADLAELLIWNTDIGATPLAAGANYLRTKWGI
jgi:hypothetical protein